jgi:hypothetical protein
MSLAILRVRFSGEVERPLPNPPTEGQRLYTRRGGSLLAPDRCSQRTLPVSAPRPIIRLNWPVVTSAIEDRKSKLANLIGPRAYNHVHLQLLTGLSMPSTLKATD